MSNSFTPSVYQQSIFDWIRNGKGNAIVNAVAGAGKTTTLIQATNIIENRSVLFAAFNKHIVTTLQSRLHHAARCQTIHSIGYACLRSKFGNKKVNIKEFKYKALSRIAANSIRKSLEHEHEIKMRVWASNTAAFNTEPPTEPPSVDEILDQIQKLVDLSRCTLSDVSDINQVNKLVSHFTIPCPIEIGKILGVLENILDTGERAARESHEIDFTDMIWLPYKWSLQPQIYDWILVDEAQDLNQAQLSLILKMRKPDTRMLFVGDPQQAIYGFSGADSESFYRIKTSTSAREFPLSICYRCPKKVVRLAQFIVTNIEHDDIAPEGEIQEILEDTITKYVKEKDLILSRATEPLIKLCLHLLANRIQASVRGKDIGTSLIAIIKEVERVKGFNFAQFSWFLNEYRNERLRKLNSKLDTEKQIADLNDQIASIEACYTAFRVQSIVELNHELEKLFSDERTAVTLSTIHRAKGLEEDRVFILYYEQLPMIWENQKEWQLEQERNLKYVAITRAKQKLFLVGAKPKN